jgi:hypothetical protein
MKSGVPVTIDRVIRRMRGGSQSFLVLGDDGQFYVAKFQGNPQGNRTLINEWIGGKLLRRLGVTTPTVRVLRLPDHVDGADLFFDTPDGRQRIAAGLHFGSLCPVNPDRIAIYDLLPDSIIERLLANGRDFITTFVFDCWAGHRDGRQAIFHRNARKSFQATLIDNGLLFGGHHWRVMTAPVICLSFCRASYRGLDMRQLAYEAIDFIRSWTLSDIDEIVASVPEEWFDRDKDAFWKMAAELIARSQTVFADTGQWLAFLRSYAYGHVGKFR